MTRWFAAAMAYGKSVYREYQADDIPGLAAEMAYHFIFALFPFVLFLAALTGFVGQALGEDRLFDEIMSNLYATLPPESATALRQPLDEVLRRQEETTLSFGAIFGLLLTLSAASNGVGTVMKAFNRAYGVEDRRNLLRKKLLAAGLTVVLSLLLVFGFVSLAVGGDLGAWIAAQVGLGATFQVVWNVVRVLLALAGISLGLALLYWKAPDVEQPFHWLAPGSIFATILLVVASAAFGLYVQLMGASSYSKTYGTVFGLILFLFFLYIASQIILLGAELNAEAMKREEPERLRHRITDPRKRLPGDGASRPAGEGAAPTREATATGEATAAGARAPTNQGRTRLAALALSGAAIAGAVVLGWLHQDHRDSGPHA
ncbi:MAG TPA: YihY/virulence factor BrkB family protein [Chloroflexota bacterium]|nr:YihY/virulence factor BrkB family protein [Chloroflexota bacterium]